MSEYHDTELWDKAILLEASSHIPAPVICKNLIQEKEIESLRTQLQDAREEVERVKAHEREKIAMLARQVKSARSDAKTFKSCWDNACHYIDKLQAEVDRLNVRIGLQDAELDEADKLFKERKDLLWKAVREFSKNQVSLKAEVERLNNTISDGICLAYNSWIDRTNDDDPAESLDAQLYKTIESFRKEIERLRAGLLQLSRHCNCGYEIGHPAIHSHLKSCTGQIAQRCLAGKGE